MSCRLARVGASRLLPQSNNAVAARGRWEARPDVRLGGRLRAKTPRGPGRRGSPNDARSEALSSLLTLKRGRRRLRAFRPGSSSRGRD